MFKHNSWGNCRICIAMCVPCSAMRSYRIFDVYLYLTLLKKKNSQICFCFLIFLLFHNTVRPMKNRSILLVMFWQQLSEVQPLSSLNLAHRDKDLILLEPVLLGYAVSSLPSLRVKINKLKCSGFEL